MAENRYFALCVRHGKLSYGVRGRVHVEIAPDGVTAFHSLSEVRHRDGRWHEQDDGSMLARQRTMRVAEPWLRLKGWEDQPGVRELMRLWAEWGGKIAPPPELDRLRSITEAWEDSLPRPLRVLVLACSATKDPAWHPLCARHRYKGPLWLTLNRLDTEQSLARQFVLSALHGLLVAEAPIENYDLKLTPARADELVLDPAHLARSLGTLRCNARGAVEVCAVGGKLYVETSRRLVQAAKEHGILAADVTFTLVNDQIGMMRRRMATWLTGTPT